MFNINQYLEKFKKFGLDDAQAKDILIDVLKEKIGVVLERKNINLRAATAYIKADPIVKNQIQIKKAALLDAISKKTDKIRDIS